MTGRDWMGLLSTQSYSQQSHPVTPLQAPPLLSEHRINIDVIVQGLHLSIDLTSGLFCGFLSPPGLRTPTKKWSRTEETWKTSKHHLIGQIVLGGTQSDYSHMGS